MTARFNTCLAIVLGNEGGFSDHKADRGGTTNFGVTQKTYDQWRRRQRLPLRPVTEITQQEVESIYHEYWVSAYCATTPEPLDLAHLT